MFVRFAESRIKVAARDRGTPTVAARRGSPLPGLPGRRGRLATASGSGLQRGGTNVRTPRGRHGPAELSCPGGCLHELDPHLVEDSPGPVLRNRLLLMSAALPQGTCGRHRASYGRGRAPRPRMRSDSGAPIGDSRGKGSQGRPPGPACARSSHACGEMPRLPGLRRDRRPGGRRGRADYPPGMRPGRRVRRVRLDVIRATRPPSEAHHRLKGVASAFPGLDPWSRAAGGPEPAWHGLGSRPGN